MPEPDTPLQFIKFRYSAEILERIGVNPALRKNLNNLNIGNVMKRLGFKKIHKKNGNGWAVIVKEGSEFNNDAFIDPIDTVEDLVSWLRPLSIMVTIAKFLGYDG